MTWTEKHIKNLHKQGRIRGYEVKERPKEGRIVSKHFKKRSNGKDWMAANLLFWANEHTVQLQEEYRFDPVRRWRADWAIAALNEHAKEFRCIAGLIIEAREIIYSSQPIKQKGKI